MAFDLAVVEADWVLLAALGGPVKAFSVGFALEVLFVVVVVVVEFAVAVSFFVVALKVLTELEQLVAVVEHFGLAAVLVSETQFL